MKIQKSFGTLTSKVGAHLSVWAHSFTLFCTLESVNVTLGLHSWPSPFHAPFIGHEPRAKVVTKSLVLQQCGHVQSPFHYQMVIEMFLYGGKN